MQRDIFFFLNNWIFKKLDDILGWQRKDKGYITFRDGKMDHLLKNIILHGALLIMNYITFEDRIII